MRLIRWLACITLSVALAGPAGATILTVDNGKSLSLQPGDSGVIVLSVTNDAGAITDNFSAWVLAVQLVPSGTTTGSIGFGTLTNPAVNPAVPRSGGDIEILNESVALTGTSVNGQTSFRSLGVFNNVDSTTLNSAATYNLGDLQITSSGDAEGTWNVFAINRPSADGTISYWYDAAFADVAYGNIAIPTSGFTSTLLGTVTVSAVPEPGGLALTAVGAACLIGAARRRRRGVRG